MKTSLIQHRVADFLKQYPPCCYLEEPNLLALAGSGRVSFHESGEFIFREGQERRPFIWVIQQGQVELLGPHLVDLLGAGDLLGLGRFLGHTHHRHSARTTSDVILYALDAVIFERMVHKYPQASSYLGAHFSLRARSGEEKTSWIDQAGPPAHLLACPPETPIREAARILSRHHADAIAVIGAGGKPLGLITTRQLSDRVATGDLSIDARCDALMQPVVTARADISLGASVLEMARTGAPCLAITRDGSSDSELAGLLTASDLALFCGNHPALLLEEVRHADSLADLARLRARAASLIAEGLTGAATVSWFAEYASEFLRALFARLVMLTRTDHPDCCWLFFGSAARKETLTPTAPECGLVYAHGPPEAFLALASEVAAGLNTCGLYAGPVPAVLPLAAWKEFYSQVITDPIVNSVYDSRSRFDLLAACGNPSLAAELLGHISAEIERRPVLIAVLANDSMVNLPPLTFFQDLVVEIDGARTPNLDLARTALDPLTDVGRVFGLARREISVTATIERLTRAAESLPRHEALFRDAAEAFRIALYQQGRTGLREASDGVNIHPAMLSRVDRQLLKSAFRSIHQLLEFTWTHQDSIARL